MRDASKLGVVGPVHCGLPSPSGSCTPPIVVQACNLLPSPSPLSSLASRPPALKTVLNIVTAGFRFIARGPKKKAARNFLEPSGNGRSLATKTKKERRHSVQHFYKDLCPRVCVVDFFLCTLVCRTDVVYLTRFGGKVSCIELIQ